MRLHLPLGPAAIALPSPSLNCSPFLLNSRACQIHSPTINKSDGGDNTAGESAFHQLQVIGPVQSKDRHLIVLHPTIITLDPLLAEYLAKSPLVAQRQTKWKSLIYLPVIRSFCQKLASTSRRHLWLSTNTPPINIIQKRQTSTNL